ncbi:MAG TPA: DUF2779 domain-containing protein [Parafilimonas sp.]|nr:DUF2779 domain-containing protein [Parafilimonas sp.]
MSPLPPKHILSKSTFMRGCKCPKSLWLYKNQFDLRDEESATQSSIFIRGTNVGLLAQQLFPGGVDASPVDAFHYQQSVADTEQYIAEGRQVIYEAAFQYEGVLCAIDLLVQQNGKWYAYEVKSSTRVKPEFIQDVALQYYVITNAGIALEEIFLVHINNEYVRQGALDIQELFNIVSVKKEAEAQQPFIINKVPELKAIALQTNMPLVTMGDHCSRPYPCDFHGYCSQGLVPKAAEQREERILEYEIRDFVKQLSWPIYYMDFETYMVPVPEYDGHWPYRQVPFQFSVHKQCSNMDALEHHFYLAENNGDPCPQFIQQLIACIGTEGTIVVYNKTFENLRLEELKADYPEFESAITAIQARIVDLMVPFRKKHYYLNAMQNSYSLKVVLPALVPELGYDEMMIADGGNASTAFYNLRFENDEAKIKETRQALLDYCALDTLGMVKVLEKLKCI